MITGEYEIYTDEWFSIFDSEYNYIKGEHAKSMYRLACVWENLIIELKLNAVKKMFLHDKAEKLTSNQFFTDIIERSVEEINSKTKKKIKYEAVKKGQEIDSIIFDFPRAEEKGADVQ